MKTHENFNYGFEAMNEKYQSLYLLDIDDMFAIRGGTGHEDRDDILIEE
jgi:hypothetical protein